MTTKDPKENVRRAVAWAKANPEKFKANQKRYREKHKEEARLREINYRARYELEHPGELARKKRERRQNKTPLKNIHMSKYWRAENPDETKWLRENAGKLFYLKNKGSQLQKNREHLMNIRCEVLYWYSNGNMVCSNCGEQRLEFLAIDHINGGGNKHRNENPGNFIYYLIRNNFPEGYQVLCHNCNILKYKASIKRKNPDADYHKYRDSKRLLMLQKYSGHETPECNCCGFNNIQGLTYFFKNKEKYLPPSKRNSNTSVWLYKNNLPIEDVEVLCSNCNGALIYYGYCPHEK